MLGTIISFFSHSVFDPTQKIVVYKCFEFRLDEKFLRFVNFVKS